MALFRKGKGAAKSDDAILAIAVAEPSLSSTHQMFTTGKVGLTFKPDDSEFFSELENEMRYLLAAAERLRDRMHLVRALGPNVSMTVAKGEWQAARAYSDRALSHAPRDAPALSNRTLLEYQVGNFDQGEVYIERLLEVMRLSRPGPNVEYSFPAAILPMIARISGRASWFDTAVPIAETVLSLSTVVAVRIILARVGLALIAEHHKDIAAAQQQYVALEPYRGIATIAILMSVDRVLGLLAQTMGNLDTAMTHFEDGLAFCREAGYRPELAWTCCDYADSLRERDGEGDRANAMSLLDESLAISSELGMRPLMERVLSRRGILKA